MNNDLPKNLTDSAELERELDELLVSLENQNKTSKASDVNEISHPSNEPLQSTKTTTKKKPSRPWLKPILIGFLVLLLLAGAASAWAGWQIWKTTQALRSQANEAQATARQAYDSFKGQNLPAAKIQVEQLQTQVGSLKSTYQQLSWLDNLPKVRQYYRDGLASFTAAEAGVRAAYKTILVIEPHADVLGFAGEGSFAGGTTEDRIGLMLRTLGEIRPALDDIGAELTIVEENLKTINPNDYPEKLTWQDKTIEIRSNIVQVQGLLAGATQLFGEARPALEQLPAIAGADGQRKKYLVLFQNDNELRPTGGFLTAYAVVFVENGKVTPEKSDDIYPLDAKFRNKPDIPPQLARFLTTERRWNLRDMNIDPNFKNSMDTFFSYYQKIPGEPANIDGIIAIDTAVLTRILDIIGPVEVPGYGTFSTQKLPACDCPQVIYALSEIITRPTPYLRENRKGVLAPLMQSIIAKTYATPRDKWPLLAEEGWKSIEQKSVQFYFLDPQFQEAAEAINAAGQLPKMPEQGDYLAVVDANLGGAKSNLFVEASGVVEVLENNNGKVKKQVEITYRNPHPPDNCNLEAGELCLNGRLNSWTRWYVPKGVVVEEALGLLEEPTIDTSQPDFDIIEGYYQLDPKSQAKVRITFSVPSAQSGGYSLTMQKQAGIDPVPMVLRTPTEEIEFLLDKDKTITTN